MSTPAKPAREVLEWYDTIAGHSQEELDFLRTATAEQIIDQLKKDTPYDVVRKLFDLIAHGADDKARQANAVEEIHAKWAETLFDNDMWIAIALLYLSDFFKKG